MKDEKYSNQMEDYKRKKKSDKAKRNNEMNGKYNSKRIRRMENVVPRFGVNELKTNLHNYCNGSNQVAK